MNDVFRLICIGLLFYSLLVLWQRWEKWPPNADRNTAPIVATQSADTPTPNTAEDIPSPPTALATAEDTPIPSALAATEDSRAVRVHTDWLEAVISEKGGSLVSLRLKKHRDENDSFLLLENGVRRQIAQSGLIGAPDAPDHYAHYSPVGGTNFSLAEDADILAVTLITENKDWRVAKIYTFTRSDYLIRLDFRAQNLGAETASPFAYFQIAHNGTSSGEQSAFLPSFFGAAVYTDESKFNKVSFEDIGDDDFPKQSNDGWIGMIQRYFAAIWLPDPGAREYFMRSDKSGNRRAGALIPFGAIAPHESKTVGARLFAGAQEQSVLNDLHENNDAPGIHLVVDYGWLTIIAVPLFKLLAWLQTFVGNWGVSIILLTFLIKLAFYPLSSVSYRSIARMKELSPRIKALQERFKDDKQQMQQAMMEMYRQQKVNPFGGCLPILLQIPVFIALYWVILGSVELRHAPFALWIDDLSTPDPYFILPILMGGSMFLQTRMSPAPPDPTQAMIIKIMPIFFSVFSLFFPSGLVLYWLVNTLLSIAQQWYIARSITGAGRK